jgi:hypothetical protein
MTQHKLRELVKASNPVYTPARLLPQDEDVRALFLEVMNRTSNPQASTDLLDTTVERRHEMETREKQVRVAHKPTPRSARRGPSRRRGLLVAAAALVVAIIAAGVVGLVGGSSDEPDVGSLQPGPISSFEDIAGTYQGQGVGPLQYVHFLEGGTMHISTNRDLVVDRPSDVYKTRFEGTQVFITTTVRCDQPDQGGTYEIHLLENGNLQFVAIDEDACALRSSFLQRGFAPLP